MKHGVSPMHVKKECISNYVALVKCIQNANVNGAKNLLTPGAAIPKIDTSLQSSSGLKCSLVGGYIGVVPGKPKLWQIVAEFKSRRINGGPQNRDLVVFETNEQNLKSWKIVKFM